MYRFIFAVLVFGALSLFGVVAAQAQGVRLWVPVNPIPEGGDGAVWVHLGSYNIGGTWFPARARSVDTWGLYREVTMKIWQN